MFNFWRNCLTFPKWLYHLTLLPAVYKGYNFSASLPNFFFFCLFNCSYPAVAILVDVKWYLHRVLACTSLRANDTERTFMWLLATYLLCGNACSDPNLFFFKWVTYFFYYWVIEVLCMFLLYGLWRFTLS